MKRLKRTHHKARRDKNVSLNPVESVTEEPERSDGVASYSTPEPTDVQVHDLSTTALDDEADSSDEGDTSDDGRGNPCYDKDKIVSESNIVEETLDTVDTNLTSSWENLISMNTSVTTVKLEELDLPSLTRKVFQSLPFKFTLQDLSKQTRTSANQPIHSLDFIAVDTKEGSEDQPRAKSSLVSRLDPELNTELYLKVQSGRNPSVQLLDRGRRSDKELMKRSVLGPNLEKLEQPPKVNESRNSLKKQRKRLREETTGPSWFNMPKPQMTDDLKRDLNIIKMRNILDPHRHYKKDNAKEIPKYFQIGTVVGGAADFYSSRLSKKERKQTIVDQLLTDADFRRRNKKKYVELQKKRESGGKKHFKKQKNKRKVTAARV